MSRECPTGGGGGGSRACFKVYIHSVISIFLFYFYFSLKCGDEGHMSRDCPTGGGAGGGGGSRACHKVLNVVRSRQLKTKKMFECYSVERRVICQENVHLEVEEEEEAMANVSKYVNINHAFCISLLIHPFYVIVSRNWPHVKGLSESVQRCDGGWKAT